MLQSPFSARPDEVRRIRKILHNAPLVIGL
jgi:hypothetical protein